jgi:hypothetical protein
LIQEAWLQASFSFLSLKALSMTLSKDDYKTAIVRIVEQLYSETNKPITGAVLAERLRTSLQASYTDVGYVKLSEPIHALVESQQLTRNRRVNPVRFRGLQLACEPALS